MKKNEKSKRTEERKKKQKAAVPVDTPEKNQLEDDDEVKVGLPDINLKKFMGCGG